MYSVFDCHCDTITTVMRKSENLYDNTGHLDIKRLKKYQRATQIFAIWLDKEHIINGYDSTIEAINFFDKEVEINKKHLKKILSKKDIDESKVNGILAIEGGESLEGDIQNLFKFYDMGVRLLTLTWNNGNELGYGAMSGIDYGLTDFGKEVISNMNDIGMLIDISHLNEKGFWEVCDITRKPIIASHSNVYEVCSHKRNLNKEQLKAIRELDGVVGLNIYPRFVKKGENIVIDDLMKHIDYMMNILGEDKIVLGCDYDGIDTAPTGLEDVSELNSLFNKITETYGENICNKISYDNMMNFFNKFYT